MCPTTYWGGDSLADLPERELLVPEVVPQPDKIEVVWDVDQDALACVGGVLWEHRVHEEVEAAVRAVREAAALDPVEGLRELGHDLGDDALKPQIGHSTTSDPKRQIAPDPISMGAKESTAHSARVCVCGGEMRGGGGGGGMREKRVKPKSKCCTAHGTNTAHTRAHTHSAHTQHTHSGQNDVGVAVPRTAG